MKIWIVGDGVIGWQIKTRKKTLPKMELIDAKIPEAFPSFEKAVEWNKNFWLKVGKALKKGGHTVVVGPAAIATEWGDILPPKSVVFDLAILTKGGQAGVLGHANAIKRVESKNAIEAAKILLLLFKEIL